MARRTKLDAVVKALHANTFDTVLGPIKFDEKGDVTDPKYVMYKWHDGKYEEIAG